MAVPMPWPTYSRTMPNPAAFASCSAAAPMSASRFPGRVAAMAASSAARVASIRRRDSSSTSPTGIVMAASACQPSMIAPQSIETMSPSPRTRGPGIPWTMTSFGEMHATAGNPLYPRKFERALRRSSTSRAAWSRSAVVAPATAARVHASCISATTAPARRMWAIWAAVLRRTIGGSGDLLVADLDEPLEDLVALADTVDRGEQPERAVVLDDRDRLALVQLEPPLHGLLGVVVALTNVAAAGVTDPRDGRLQVHVIGALAVLAHAPA